jgi:hypothetical protein
VTKIKLLIPGLAIIMASGIFLYIVNNPMPCGYHSDKISIPCKCLGITKVKQDTKGPMPLEGKVSYCYGFAKTKVCFGGPIARQVTTPYLCSRYPYKVRLTDRVTQHPLHFYPDTKYSYDAELADGRQVILETTQEVTCPLVNVQGFIEKVTLGDGSGRTKQDYRGEHLFAVDFVCRE